MRVIERILKVLGRYDKFVLNDCDNDDSAPVTEIMSCEMPANAGKIVTETAEVGADSPDCQGKKGATIFASWWDMMMSLLVAITQVARVGETKRQSHCALSLTSTYFPLVRSDR